MRLCGVCQPVVALELHAPAGRPLRTCVRVAWWGGLVLGGGGGRSPVHRRLCSSLRGVAACGPVAAHRV